MTIARVRNLSVHRGSNKVLSDVSLELETGGCLAVVGESGSGKSTLLQALTGLIPFVEGTITIKETNVTPRSRLRPGALAKDMQMVFQDPNSSLDPRWPAWRSVTECLAKQPIPVLENRAIEVLEAVGLDESFAHRFPQELSGGQKQRLGIARAIAPSPAIVLLDEPVSALDTSVQAGIVQLLRQLQSDLGLSYLLVSHDLAVVRHLAGDIAVLKSGRVVEFNQTAALIDDPQDPYTQSLLAAARLLA